MKHILNKCNFCNKDFAEKEIVTRWITSGILKFKFKKESDFYLIYPFHYNCLLKIREKNDFLKDLDDKHFEAAEIEQVSQNTLTAINYYKANNTVLQDQE